MREAEEYQRLVNGAQQIRPPNYGNRETTYVKIWGDLSTSLDFW